MAPQGGKTRTTQAHGPSASKKPYKAPSSTKPIHSAKSAPKKPFTPTPTSTSTSDRKRKLDLDPEAEEPPRPTIVSSLLNAPEEIDFVRGGGTGLSQVEVREAQLEGEREADEEEAKVEGEGDLGQEKERKDKKKRRKLEREAKGIEIKEKNVLPKDARRVENLNYKRLVPGTKLLAQIVLIRPLELIVSLPNQLFAHIPITNISSELNSRLSSSSSSSDEESSDDDDTPSLSSLFSVGEWVSTIVISSKSSDSKVSLSGRSSSELIRSSARVELSLEVEKVNEGIARGDLKTGFTMSASVKSEEDHGWILSLGLPSLTSFLGEKEAKKLGKEVQVGMVVRCRIKDVSENGRTCNVSVDPVEVTGSILSTATSITSILPSTLLTALITSVLPSGLNVSFHGYFTGTISSFHLPPLSAGTTMEDKYKIGQKIKARVLWDVVGSSPKIFALGATKELLGLKGGKELREWEEEWLVGKKVEVKVIGVDDEWGLTVVVKKDEEDEDEERVRGFVHISHITDDHLSTIPKSSPWKLNTSHTARIIGHAPFDRLLQLSLQPSVLERSFLRVEDVKVGEVVQGKVKRLSEKALFVEIGGSVDGVVWPMHYSDIKLKNPEKKFKVGGKVTARIYSADPEKNRVVLTLKKALINSELPILKAFADVKVGTITHATVSKVMEKGVLVDFFGGLRAIVPAVEAAEGFTSDLSTLFTVGKVLTVRIISVDTSDSRIVASVRQALAPTSQVDESISSVSIGDVSSGTISALHDTNIVITLQPSGVKALISYTTLARHRKVTVEALKELLVKGQSLDDLVVVSKNADKGLVIVGLVPSKSATPAVPKDAEAENRTFESLQVGQVLPNGRICGKILGGTGGYLIQISKSVKGRILKTEISDDFDLAAKEGLEVGAVVPKCVVLSVDQDQRRLDVSIRPSRVGGEGVVKDAKVDSLDDVKQGQTIRGFVKNIANHGLFVSLGAEVTARVQIKELFDEFVKEWKPRFAVGQLVEGKIIAVNKLQNQVELSLRKSASAKESTIEIGDLKKGQVVKGVVKRVESYGAFIRIEGSTVSGLCHKSKITDDEEKEWTSCVKVGQEVTAIVTEINTESKKVSLGLRRSLFPEGLLPEKEDEDEDDDEDDDDEEEEEDDEEEEEESDGEEVDLSGIQFDDGTSDEDSDAEMEVDEAPVASTSKLPAPQKSATSAAPLAVSTGFNWDGKDDDEEALAEEEDSDSEEEETVAAPASKKRAVEQQSADLDSSAPTSVADFERLLLGSANSSYLWIQYIAFYVGLSQVDKAREIGRRALRTINFREEQEKLNVWVALLNLENTYGTETTLATLFTEAVQSNDAKTVYLRLVDIYERAGKYEAEEELFQKLVKKFGQSSKAWTLFGQFYLTRGKPDEARDLLPRSLKSLEKRKHVKTIAKFAQLEFKLGDAERGRTIFEGVMDSYPKRLDLWFIYIDMEIKTGNTAGVRALFDRVLSQHLSSKKGKSVFKKWLTYEKEHGDENGVETCKKRAMEFVQSLAK